MPVETVHVRNELIRVVTCVHGSLEFEMECRPRFDYARSRHRIQVESDYAVIFHNTDNPHDRVRLLSSVPMAVRDDDVSARFSLRTSEKAYFMLEYITDQPPVSSGDLPAFSEKRLFETINYWKQWVSQSTYKGRWMEMVHRSALVLKLLISNKYGSIIAAPTFGLPEEIGGIRNWDYRYTWIRDASFTVYALLKLGYEREAREFMKWVEQQCNDIGKAGRLSLMYGLDGRIDLFEKELPHLEGYRGSRPVRIGNAAYNQVQLDIYGELLDAVYLYDKHADHVSYDFWVDISRQVDWVFEHWRQEDQGIWEVRGGKREYLYSRMMFWVAIDSAIHIVTRNYFSLPIL